MQKLRDKFGLPNEEDIAGAVRGILRMQKYNDLKPKDLAEGIINGTDYGDSLDWDVCFEVAKEIYSLDVLLSAKEWFWITLNKIQKSIREAECEEEQANFKEYETHVHEYLALINYELGLNAEALVHIETILSVYPQHPVKTPKSER